MRDETGKFLPGESGNPNGRPPKGEALTDALRAKVDKDTLASKLIEMALEKGDLGALKYIYDRIDGRPVETVTQTLLSAPKVVHVFHDNYDPTDSEDIETVEEQ